MGRGSNIFMKIPVNYYSPDDEGILEDSTLTPDGILDILNSDDESDEPGKTDDSELDEKEEKEGKDKKEEIEEDDKEGKEDKKEEKEIKLNEDEEDELTFKHIPRQQILKKYPNFFKEFPSIEKTIYKEQQYSELFPTMQEAKDSKEAAENYQHFESALLSGNISPVLNSLKQSDPNAYEKVVETFLPTLIKSDKNASAIITAQVMKGSIITMFSEGKARNNENLQLAAQILHEFAFGTGQISAYVQKHKIDDTKNPKEEELQNREQSFIKQQFDVAVSDVSERTENVIKSTIDRHIDPNNIMTPYVRGKAVQDIISSVDEEIKKDRSFNTLIEKLWEKSMNDNFSKGSKDKIRNALLAKAQTVLPGILRKVRAEALRGNAARSFKKEEVEEKEEKPKVSRMAPARENSDRGKNKDGRGMKTADFFMQD